MVKKKKVVEEIKLTREDYSLRMREALNAVLKDVPEEFLVQVLGDLSLTAFETFYPFAGKHLLGSVVAEYINVAIRIDNPVAVEQVPAPEEKV